MRPTSPVSDRAICANRRTFQGTGRTLGKSHSPRVQRPQRGQRLAMYAIRFYHLPRSLICHPPAFRPLECRQVYHPAAPSPGVDRRLLLALLLRLLRSALARAYLRSWVIPPAGYRHQFVGPLPRRLQQPWWAPCPWSRLRGRMVIF